ncbi:pentapeptide repeat-containing protein [Nostoc sp.]|uniref:pentapeptide repeat-containing protein n=1 Tax=Nostoc sp. TaxID=1180 RepID=UPI002FF77FD9
MTNPEHLRRLWEGANRWNQWRQQNPHELPDLEGACITRVPPGIPEDLRRFDLSGSNLRGANLTGVRLSRANLERADLTQAILCFASFFTQTNFIFPSFINSANLSRANLTQANLRMARLDNANLTRANLQEADLWNASFRFANLQEADLTRATLTYANFWSANLQESILCNANLSESELSFTNLSEATLSYANLSQAIFYGAKLNQAIFYKANLNKANLSATQALRTNFAEAVFTGACLENWNINSGTIVDNIDCQYVYLRSNNQSRIPSNRDFKSEEFTQLLQIKIAVGKIQQLLRDLKQKNPGATEEEQHNFLISSVPPGMREKLMNTLQAGSIEMIKQIINNPFFNILIEMIKAW